MMGAKWIVFLFLITYAYCRTDPLNFNMESSKKYCGSILADVLSLVCKGRYNTLFDFQTQFSDRQKRTVAELEYPFKSKKHSVRLLRSVKRKRGVFNECCVKPCAFSELKSYCAPEN